MGALLRVGIITLLAASVGACPSQKPVDTGPPPPRGMSYDEYLGVASQKRPADTNDDDSMVVHLIDIGQGLAVLLEFPCGVVLVDTGAESNSQWDGVGALAIYLEEFFNRRPDLEKTINLLLITHPHLDHTRGIDAVLRNYTVENIVDNGMRNEWMVFDGVRQKDMGGRAQIALQEWAKQRADTVGYRTVKVGEIGADGLSDAIIDPVHGCGRATTDPLLRVLWGQLFEGRDTFPDNANDHSVSLRVDYGKSSVFIPGDLETIGNSRLDRKFKANKALLDVDIYVVGHHGSKNATHGYMMQNMTPKVALISASPFDRNLDWTGRRYGHPNKKAVDHLIHRDYGVSWKRDPVDVMVGIRGAWKDEKKEIFHQHRIEKAVYCTCWDGSIRVRANANGWLDVETTKQAPAAKD